MLGPLVIAGVSLKHSSIKKLASLGIDDSKKLSPSLREKLYKKILHLVDDYHIAKIGPRTIDRSVSKHKLNLLEAKYMAKVISKLKPGISYVDSCDVNPRRFAKEIARLSKTSKIRSYHHADARFTVVSAASILAKVSRDREIARLRRRHDLGSGYPSDLKTVRFMKKWISSGNNIPDFVRTSWKPVRILMMLNNRN